MHLSFLDFHWTQLLQPQWYIDNGGIWFVLFAVFAETGLFAGFFLPGDSLLFVAGIYCTDLVETGLHLTGMSPFADLLVLVVLISAAGVLGNFVGYWFGKKSGPYLYERKDNFIFKQKYLLRAKDFYDRHGGSAIVLARFLPIIRTFAPIIAGVVGMDAKKFFLFNLAGSVAWVFTMLFAGHYLQQFFFQSFGFDLKKHLEVIVIGIVLVSTLPLLFNFLFAGKKSANTHS